MSALTEACYGRVAAARAENDLAWIRRCWNELAAAIAAGDERKARILRQLLQVADACA